MSPAPPQKELFARPAPTRGTIFVNDRVCVETEQGQRVLFVHGIVFSHYSIKDRSAEAYAMVQLFEAGYADQNDIARCFGYSARALRRYQERLKAGGLSALVRPEGRLWFAKTPADFEINDIAALPPLLCYHSYLCFDSSACAPERCFACCAHVGACYSRIWHYVNNSPS